MIRVVIDDVPTSWVDIAEMKDDGPKEIPSRWGITLQVVDLDISRDDAIDYEKNRQAFDLVPVDATGDAVDKVAEAIWRADTGSTSDWNRLEHRAPWISMARAAITAYRRG